MKVRALCQLHGQLVIMEGSPSPGGGHCPVCRGTEFYEGPYGWLWCRGCEDFAVTKEHALPEPEPQPVQAALWPEK